MENLVEEENWFQEGLLCEEMTRGNYQQQQNFIFLVSKELLGLTLVGVNGVFRSNHPEGCLFEVQYLSRKWATRSKETKGITLESIKAFKVNIVQVFTSQWHQSCPQSVTWDILDMLYLKVTMRHRRHDAWAIQEWFSYIKTHTLAAHKGPCKVLTHSLVQSRWW